DNALGIENIDDFREAVHIDKSALDIGDLNTLEDEEMFVGSARFEESCLASLAEIESTVSRTVSSNNSSRSSLAEEIPIGFDESSGSELSNSPAQIENGVETVLSLCAAEP
ncbi:hypothetical protein H4217_008348, partial [Coemansia sp. RSA 1939]